MTLTGGWAVLKSILWIAYSNKKITLSAFASENVVTFLITGSIR
jgi:hypothetical protein